MNCPPPAPPQARSEAHTFCPAVPTFGFTSFMPLAQAQDPAAGYVSPARGTLRVMAQVTLEQSAAAAGARGGPGSAWDEA